MVASSFFDPCHCCGGRGGHFEVRRPTIEWFRCGACILSPGQQLKPYLRYVHVPGGYAAGSSIPWWRP